MTACREQFLSRAIGHRVGPRGAVGLRCVDLVVGVGSVGDLVACFATMAGNRRSSRGRSPLEFQILRCIGMPRGGPLLVHRFLVKNLHAKRLEAFTKAVGEEHENAYPYAEYRFNCRHSEILHSVHDRSNWSLSLRGNVIGDGREFFQDVSVDRRTLSSTARYMAGSSSRVRRVEEMVPPTTTTASGF